MRTIKVKMILAGALAIGLTTPTIGVAASPDQLDASSVRVSYGDLNIHSKAGAKVLYSRLKNAAEEACSIESHVRFSSLRTVQKTRVCYQEALASAVERIESDELSKIHAG